MAAYHWIEPQYVHDAAALRTGLRALTPPFVLPPAGLSWVDGTSNTARTRDSKRSMWRRCQQALQESYQKGVVGTLFPGASGVWHTIGTHLARQVYVVKDLGEMDARETSVQHVNADEVKFGEDVMRLGARETPDSEEYLYMRPAYPPTTR
ncbi:hypothetical protein G647_10147 [Cladophialophora carrionii CBS 160.54]|uniref:Uncharacterized protein n=1 Tax=Cladophialophora carrionii CBS 160.54 TaxID=1279043 RepID=V9DL36_9EURO|nr:uncharacterized protein G647_10147 [Cladophialophora carrionii CBS 160.54]ETI27048.1 hypothetical protein G647_10147 [Cladophialophora carrionii CBS 160.54]